MILKKSRKSTDLAIISNYLFEIIRTLTVKKPIGLKKTCLLASGIDSIRLRAGNGLSPGIPFIPASVGATCLVQYQPGKRSLPVELEDPLRAIFDAGMVAGRSTLRCLSRSLGSPAVPGAWALTGAGAPRRLIRSARHLRAELKILTILMICFARGQSARRSSRALRLCPLRS